MTSLKFLLDNMCANFTENCMYDLVRIMVDQRPCTVSDISLKVVDRDHSLDIGSARTLTKAAIEALAQRGEVAIRGSYVFPLD